MERGSTVYHNGQREYPERLSKCDTFYRSKDDRDRFSDITDFNRKEGDEVKWLGDDWMS
jgi:hypothetical protein